MSPPRVALACLLGAALVGLVGWQWHRERLVRFCQETGGAWDGSRCLPSRSRPLLQRGLYRA